MTVRRLALALLLAALAALATMADAPAHAALAGPGAGPPVRVLPDPDGGPVVEHPPLARTSRTDAIAVASADREVRRALVAWPDAGLRVRWIPDEQRWRVSVRTTGTASTLLVVDIDDRSGRIVSREHPTTGDRPTHHTDREAIDAAVADPRTRSKAREWGGVDELRARASIETPGVWQVDLHDPDRTDGDPERPVIRAFVDDLSLNVAGVYTGYAIDWQLARGSREKFGGTSSRPLVWLAFMALFVLVAVDWRRWRTLATVDVLVLTLGLGISHEAFQRGAIEWSVPLAVPPLLWLGARLALQFARGVPRRPADPPRPARASRVRPVPLVLLVVLCVALAGLRCGLAWYGGNVIDVGYAGVAGARAELAGDAPWGTMPDDVNHGDTYGPANYLAYVPATWLVDDPETDSAEWGVPAAMLTSIAADLGCALLLAWIGWRWISRRAGALLALGWLACPWTIWATSAGTNDALVALLVLAAFAAMRAPVARGTILAAAAMVKFAPAIALPALLHAGSRGRARQAARTIAGFALASAALTAWALWRIDDGSIGGGLRTLWDATVGFQATRDSPFSPWGLYHLGISQHLAQALVLAAALAACLRPRVRDAWQVAAGIGALLVASQLVVTHWTYLYAPWFVPFVLIALVVRRELPGGESRPDMLRAHEQR